MGSVFYLFGAREGDLVGVVEALAAVLEIEFECRESSYKGGEYFRNRRGIQGKITVESNWVDDEGYLAESEYPEYSVLIYVSSMRGSAIDAMSRLDGISLLRSEEI